MGRVIFVNGALKSSEKFWKVQKSSIMDDFDLNYDNVDLSYDKIDKVENFYLSYDNFDFRIRSMITLKYDNFEL